LYSTVPLEEKRKFFGSEAPAFFLKRSWSREGISATFDGRPGEEAAVSAMANCNIVRADEIVVTTVSEAGD